MIGVVVPAHNEESLIGSCLESIFAAAQSRDLQGEPVEVVVACDRCSDRTEYVARQLGARIAVLRSGNVGRARAAGARLLLADGARWLAFTDADSVVSPSWLADQLALKVDAVCGTIAVADWESYGARMDAHFSATYFDRDGHRHIHGANLGVSADAYRRVGGFKALASSEDVALVRALDASGASIAWSAAPRVVTSARKAFRAPGGFGAILQRIHQEQSWATATVVAASA